MNILYTIFLLLCFQQVVVASQVKTSVETLRLKQANLQTQVAQSQTREQVLKTKRNLVDLYEMNRNKKADLEDKKQQVLIARRTIAEKINEYDLASTIEQYKADPATCYHQKKINLSEKGMQHLFQLVRVKAALERSNDEASVNYWSKVYAENDFLVEREIRDEFRKSKLVLFDESAKLYPVFVKNNNELFFATQRNKQLILLAQQLVNKRKDLSIAAWQKLVAKKVAYHEQRHQYITQFVGNLVASVQTKIIKREKILFEQQLKDRKQAENLRLQLIEKEKKEIQRKADRERHALKFLQEQEQKRLERQKQKAISTKKTVKAKGAKKNGDGLSFFSEEDEKFLDELVQENKKKMSCGSDESEEFFMQAAQDRRIEIQKHQKKGVKYRNLVAIIKQYDREHNIPEDGYSKARQLVYQLKDLLLIHSEFNIEMYQYLWVEFDVLDRTLRQQGLLLSTYFENEHFIHVDIASRLTELEKLLRGATLSTAKNRWIALKESEQDLCKQVLDLSSQMQRLKKNDKRCIVYKAEIEVKKREIEEIEKLIQAQDLEVNKFIAIEQLTKIQKYILPESDIDTVSLKSTSPVLDTVGFLTVKHFEDYYKDADSLIENILKTKGFVEVSDIKPLIRSFMNGNNIISENLEENIAIMGDSIIHASRMLSSPELTQEFKQDMFEKITTGTNDMHEVDALADITKFQTMLIDIVVKHKEALKKA